MPISPDSVSLHLKCNNSLISIGVHSLYEEISDWHDKICLQSRTKHQCIFWANILSRRHFGYAPENCQKYAKRCCCAMSKPIHFLMHLLLQFMEVNLFGISHPLYSKLSKTSLAGKNLPRQFHFR